VAGRDADVLDAVADAVGSFVFPLGIHAIRYGNGTRLPNRER
jgi:hypothetical protein